MVFGTKFLSMASITFALVMGSNALHAGIAVLYKDGSATQFITKDGKYSVQYCLSSELDDSMTECSKVQRMLVPWSDRVDFKQKLYQWLPFVADRIDDRHLLSTPTSFQIDDFLQTQAKLSLSDIDRIQNLRNQIALQEKRLKVLRASLGEEGVAKTELYQNNLKLREELNALETPKLETADVELALDRHFADLLQVIEGDVEVFLSGEKDEVSFTYLWINTVSESLRFNTEMLKETAVVSPAVYKSILVTSSVKNSRVTLSNASTSPLQAIEDKTLVEPFASKKVGDEVDYFTVSTNGMVAYTDYEGSYDTPDLKFFDLVTGKETEFDVYRKVNGGVYRAHNVPGYKILSNFGFGFHKNALYLYGGTLNLATGLVDRGEYLEMGFDTSLSDFGMWKRDSYSTRPQNDMEVEKDARCEFPRLISIGDYILVLKNEGNVDYFRRFSSAFLFNATDSTWKQLQLHFTGKLVDAAVNGSQIYFLSSEERETEKGKTHFLKVENYDIEEKVRKKVATKEFQNLDLISPNVFIYENQLIVTGVRKNSVSQAHVYHLKRGYWLE